MKEYNVAPTKEFYYSQRNNELRPSASCQCTSTVTALNILGIEFPKDDKFKQPEDSLLNFINTSKEVDEFYKKFDNYSYTQYINSGKDAKNFTPPQEVHGVLSYGTNLWLGKNVDTFKIGITTQDILFEFISGRPVVFSGVFNKFHHVVCGVGFTTSQETEIKSPTDIDLTKVINVIINDPYGDYRYGYSNLNGCNIRMPFEDFRSMINTTGSLTKNAHFYKK